MNPLPLADFPPDELRISQFVPATTLTTFGLGGVFSQVLEPQSTKTLQELLRRCHQEHIPWRILGAGSNLIINRLGISELTIKLGRRCSGWSELPAKFELSMLASLEESRGKASMSLAERFGVGDTRAEADLPEVLVLAGSPLMSLSRQVSAAGLTGLEFAAGIPGTLGGAVKMNAGAHGSDIASVVDSVLVLDEHGLLLQRTADELAFSYRHSAITEREIVIAAVLRLGRGSPEEILARRAEALHYRKQTQPLHLPSAGSVFRNPGGSSPAAAVLLDQLGFKGRTCGNVGYSTMHANWLVRLENSGEAEDALQLINQAQQEVEKQFGITLVPEIIHW